MAREPALRPEGIAHFHELRLLFRPVELALAVVFEDFGGHFGGEVFVGEFGADFLQLLFHFGDFFADALALGGDVDEAVERQE